MGARRVRGGRAGRQAFPRPANPGHLACAILRGSSTAISSSELVVLSLARTATGSGPVRAAGRVSRVTPKGRLMAFLRALYEHLEEWLSSFFLAVMILCLGLQVLVRIFTGAALDWAEEMSRFTFIWAVYIGASLAAKRGAHVRLSAQFLLASTRVRLVFFILADTLWVAFNLFFVLIGVKMVANALQFPEISPTLQITKAYVEMVIPIAFVMMSYRTLELYVRHWRQGTLADLVDIEKEM
jgi:TRAP-type C4-dicarboxylate transport system permease small subunit